MSFLDKVFSSKPTRDEFAQIVMRELADRGVTGARYDKESFSIHFGSITNAIFLDNTYVIYCRSNKQQRAEALIHLTAGFAAKPTIPKDYTTVRANLMPIVRDACYSSLVELDIQRRGDTNLKPALSRPLADGLVTMLAYDTEHSILQVNQESFANWGVSFEEAFATAVQNLRDKTDTRLLAETEPGLYRARWSDSYDSARILLTDLFHRLSLNGDPVAFIPNRNQLWATGHRNTPALQSFLAAAEEFHFAAHPLSARLYVLVDGKWRPYLPEEPALRTLCQNLLRKRSGVDYEQQKKALETIHARSQTDIFVATYTVLQRKDGSFYSMTVWSKGVDTLLPEADSLALSIDPTAKNLLFVPWEAAFPLLQDLMKREESLCPIRYRVRTFPGNDQIEKLRALAKAAGTNAIF
jgi:hypothetical protein